MSWTMGLSARCVLLGSLFGLGAVCSSVIAQDAMRVPVGEGAARGAGEVGERGVPILIADQLEPTAQLDLAPSQVFPDNPGQDTLLFDEIRTTRPFALEQLIVFGQEAGDPLCNQAVIGQVWEGRPGDGGNVVLQGNGNQVGNDLVVDFGGQVLPPGEYLVNAHVIRPFAGGCAGGQWFAQVRSLGSSREVGVWQPNAPGAIAKLTDVGLTDQEPLDLMFQLRGFLADFQDCDGNGQDDWIDLLSGTSHDTNGDGVPDVCQREGLGGHTPDFDLDGIADAGDAQPTVYTTGPGPAPAVVSVEQLSFPETEYSLAASLTEHAAVRIEFPRTPGVHLYVNIELDGRWVVQNQVTFTTVSADVEPTNSQVYYVDLGNPRGVAVSSAEVRWWVDPIGMESLPPGTGQVVPVTEAEYRVGGGGPGVEDPGPVPSGGDDEASPAPSPTEEKTTEENEGITVSDLKWSFERNSCGPNSVGGSFAWLLKTYKLMLPPNVDSVDELVQRFRFLMDTLLGSSTTDVEMKAAKEGFIRKHKLPLVVHSGNVGTPNRLDNLITPQDILEELKKGQDVEILYGKWRQDGPGGTWRRHGGHFVAIKSITKCVKDGMTTWKIEWVHDWKQSACGGIDCVSVAVTEGSKDLDNDDTNETGWELENTPFADMVSTRVLESFVAESPTFQHMMKCVRSTLAGFITARDAANADGNVDLAEAKDLLERLKALKRLARRTLALADTALGPSSPSKRFLKRLIQSCCVGIEKLEEHIKDLGGKASGRSVLPQDVGALLVVEGDSMFLADLPAIEALLPPDADFDDVPDGLDNAPNDANPDQADQDNNGTADVLELSALNDCNDNGVMDVYEVGLEAIVAYQLDGTPVMGFPFDLDMNGTPDQCETTPPVECTADLDDDLDVDIFDFGVFAAHFGMSVSPGQDGDLDLDGDVDVFDFGEFAVQFGCGL